ncbi:MAG: cytochrome c oxidase subunit 3 [Bacteroidetes bacterium]|nr:cytochrome c oxidase subunit 3 [Bacteroidota bacterium]
MSTVVTFNTDNNPNSHKAQRFTMRLAIVSLSMTFAGLTSYYIIYKAKETWSYFEMPSIFWVSTLILAISSMSMMMAHMANRKNNVKVLRLGLILTLGLGLAFCLMQWLGWQELMSRGVFLSGSGNGNSIFYVITGAHALHVFGGLMFFIPAVIRSFFIFKKSNNTYLNKESDKLKIRTDLLSVYWHFMGLLWLYLFIFLNVNH